MKAVSQQTIWEDLIAGENLSSLIKEANNPCRFQTELKDLIDSFYRERSRIIEIGCSTGITSLILDDRFDKTLVDLNAGAIGLSRALFEHFHKEAIFIVGDMFRLPLPDESYDIVFNSGVLEHFDYADRVNALKEYRRILKPDGILLIAFPNHFSKPYKLAYDYLTSRGRWPYPKEIALYDIKKELYESGMRLVERKILDRKTPTDYLSHVKVVGNLLKIIYAVVGYEGYLTSVTAVKCRPTSFKQDSEDVLPRSNARTEGKHIAKWNRAMLAVHKIPVPKVSVVIPTHNRADLLTRAIRSVLEQTVQDFEIIVVDDASSQDVASVVRSFDDRRLVLVRHQARRGGGASRNTGIRHTRSEFVAFLDDDDEWLPEKLELQLARINSNDLPGMVYTGALHINQKSGSTSRVFQPCESWDLRRLLVKQNVIGTTSTIMVRRECFNGGLMFDETLRSCQDWDLYLKIVKQFVIGCIGRPLVKYYVHDSRITRNYDAALQGHRAIFQRVVTEYSCSPAVIGYHHYKIGKLALQFGDKKTGRQELLFSLSNMPWAWSNCLFLLASFLHRGLYRKSSLFFQWLKSQIASMHHRFGLH